MVHLVCWTVRRGSIMMVAIGTLRESSIGYLVTPFKKFDSYGMFFIEQDFEPANEYLDVNSLGSVEYPAAYTL
jgi:hypothetical protein